MSAPVPFRLDPDEPSLAAPGGGGVRAARPETTGLGHVPSHWPRLDRTCPGVGRLAPAMQADMEGA